MEGKIPKVTIINTNTYFLNLWLNDKLWENYKNLLYYVQHFQEIMKNSHRDFFTNNMLDKILRNTENHDFEDIKFLCGLYNNKKKIYGIMTTNNSGQSKKICEQYTTEYYEKYKEGLYRCVNGSSNLLSI